jgi:general L-amino acid transport system permease protein
LTAAPSGDERVPLWRNTTFLKWLVQIVVLVAVFALFVMLGSRAAANWEAADIKFGWQWLTESFGVLLSEGIDVAPTSGARALLVGAVNTLRLAVAGIVAATIIGLLIGVARLSDNWIVAKIAAVYVETVRNVPLLVQIFFWQALVIGLPSLTEADIGSHWFLASNRGFALAWVRWNGGFWPWLVFVIAGFVVGRRVARRRRHWREQTGRPGHEGVAWIGTVLLFALAGWFLWPILRPVAPVLDRIGLIINGLPSIIVPLTLAGAALLLAVWWIRGFFASRRTPGGSPKLSGDDRFRVALVGVAPVMVVIVAFGVGSYEFGTLPGDELSVAEHAVTGLSNVVDWMATNFDPAEAQPLVTEKASVVQRGNFIQFQATGAVLTIPFFTVLVAISTYAGAFIAEIVRGAILAVSKGQTDAAKALGMRRRHYLRFIVLPQAARIILPPLGNQYLNIVKYAALGVATAYPDIVKVGITAINQTGQILPIIIIWVAFFLGVSFAISAIVNYYNRKMKLVDH